jgi:hypothetical protein
VKKLLVAMSLLIAIAAGVGARAEDVCVDAGAVGPIGISMPAVCVPVP